MLCQRCAILARDMVVCAGCGEDECPASEAGPSPWLCPACNPQPALSALSVGPFTDQSPAAVSPEPVRPIALPRSFVQMASSPEADTALHNSPSVQSLLFLQPHIPFSLCIFLP